MNIFTFSTSMKNLEKQIHFYSMTSEKTHPVISKTIAQYIHYLKEQITTINDQWDYTKKITNPYEYIHTPIPTTHVSVAKYKPLSRAYYKMIEIIDTFHLTWDYPIRTFHLAEGPGGFIEAIAKRRNQEKDIYTGMTLVTSDYNTPGWRKSQQFLKKWKDQVNICYGKDGTGNLFVYENYLSLKDQAHTHELVTGDGGFDFSICYHMQECMSSRLVFTQLVYACMLQKEGGTFILKMFDCYTRTSVDMLWILSTLYRKMNVVKPCTSRYANSEKYVVCRGYRQEAGNKILPMLERILRKLDTPPPGMHIQQILSEMPPLYFLNQIEEMNSILGQQQMDIIRLTLNMIHMNAEERNEKMKVIQYGNLQKCVMWCKKYNEPHISLKQTYADVIVSPKYRPPRPKYYRKSS